MKEKEPEEENIPVQMLLSRYYLTPESISGHSVCCKTERQGDGALFTF